VDQVRLATTLLDERGRRPEAQPTLPRLSNLVFMGMGEPFDNLAAVTRAIRLLCDPFAFHFAPSRITVSTVGVIDKLAAFFSLTRAELAISLNAPDDARRRQLIPIAARHDLAELRQAVLVALPPRRRVLFQYALFAGFNDALSDAEALASYVRPVRCRVNVIAANRGPDPNLRRPADAVVEAFVGRLHELGVRTILRRARGADVGAACGQLAGAYRHRHPTNRTRGETRHGPTP
jgi:23S rRNA (adenine2503-C2)-methyltransferase